MIRRLQRIALVLLGVVALLVPTAPATATPATTIPATVAPGPADAPEYWFDTWHLPQLWDSGARGQGVTIAEIDSGVNASLPALSGSILSGTDFGVEGGDGRTDREIDAFGHGTAMASIMVARNGDFGITGIAPSAKILPIAVPLQGTTDASPQAHLPDAIRYAADHGAQVISMSLGGRRYPDTDDTPCPDDEQAAVDYALRKGIVLVAASGNDGPTRNAVEEPGVCLGVVSVGATSSDGTIASFSARHPYLTLTAPGVNIPSLSRVPGEAYSGAGTSQATAITSAVVALVRSKYPTLSGKQVVTRVLATLTARRSPHSEAYGYGALDAYAAVTATVPASAKNPVYAAVAPYLARDKGLTGASTASSRLPAPPRRALGPVDVGDPPSTISSWLVWGVVLAGVGVLALLVLGGSGLVLGRRRRRMITAATAAIPGWPPPGWAAASTQVRTGRHGMPEHPAPPPPAWTPPPDRSGPPGPAGPVWYPPVSGAGPPGSPH